MKYLPIIAGVLLGLLFLMASVTYFLMPMPPLPPGTPEPVLKFMEAFGPTGYMTFVKVCELIGGLLVLIPRTRNLGLLILGPIIINILAFTVFVSKGVGAPIPMLAMIVVLPLYLLWVERKSFAALVK